MIYIGIDNGLDGGIASLSGSGALIRWSAMPTRIHAVPARKKAKAKRIREIDSGAVLSILDSMAHHRWDCAVIFEECPHHSQSKAAMRGMGIGAGKILGVLETRGFAHHRILSTDWQPAILGKVPQGKTKECALAKARELWPNETWLAMTSRSTKPHDGAIDAALIAEYGRISNL